MAHSISRALHWFRRDLRLTDNTSLNAACNAAKEVLPLYILSDWSKKHSWTGPKRQQFLCECLDSLSKNISHLGGSLVIRQGDAIEELEKLITEEKIEAIYFNRDVDLFGVEIEKKVISLCQKLNVQCHHFKDAVLHGPTEVLKGDGTPYRVYTPFSRRWLAEPKAEPGGKPKSLTSPKNVQSLPLPSLRTWKLEFDGEKILPGGEKAARKRMKVALDQRVANYEDLRDIPSVPGTSRLSQDLRFGTLSVRELFQKAEKIGSLQFLKELGWREFYFQILHYFPEVLEHEFNSDWRGLPWAEAGEQYEDWKAGRTGFPIIDAGIRELLATGFMHNRVRMIVAMFLTKDLHLDWRLGETFFLQHLVDGEIAANNGGWQWSAGTGADAAPYFRIQNPWSQTKRFDPEGDYIRKWVPELAGCAGKLFHAPPENGSPIATGYIMPIVNHSDERNATLAIFKKHREHTRG